MMLIAVGVGVPWYSSPLLLHIGVKEKGHLILRTTIGYYFGEIQPPAAAAVDDVVVEVAAVVVGATVIVVVVVV
jgi:hypothetical protein